MPGFKSDRAQDFFENKSDEGDRGERGDDKGSSPYYSLLCFIF